ncbi:hypothetical protein CR513_22201, partial [Mucuna pruriens]
MTLIWNYLHNHTSIEDKVEGIKVRWTAVRYIFQTYHLYKRGYTKSHVDSTWVTSWQHRYLMRKDCRLYVRSCRVCQAYDPIDHFLTKEM